MKCKQLDINEGLDNCMNPETYLFVISEFYREIDGRINELEKYLSSDDIKNFTIKIHALKSASRQIGAVALSEKAKQLEVAGMADNTNYIYANMDTLIKDLHDLRVAFAPCVNQGEFDYLDEAIIL